MAKPLSDNQTLRIRCIRETGRLPALRALMDGEGKTEPQIIEWIHAKSQEDYDKLLLALNDVNSIMYEQFDPYFKTEKK